MAIFWLFDYFDVDKYPVWFKILNRFWCLPSQELPSNPALQVQVPVASLQVPWPEHVPSPGQLVVVVLSISSGLVDCNKPKTIKLHIIHIVITSPNFYNSLVKQFDFFHEFFNEFFDKFFRRFFWLIFLAIFLWIF